MKFKDFSRKQFVAAGVTSQDVEAMLSSSALADLEIPDDVADKMSKAFLTREAAKNDSEIVSDIRKHMRKEVFTKVDEELTPYYDLLPEEQATKIKGVFETYERMRLLSAAVKEVLASKKGKADTEVQKTEAEWAAKLKAVEDGKKSEIDSLKKGFKDTNLKNSLIAKINGYAFADAHKPLKDTIAQLVIQSLSSKSLPDGTQVVLDQDETGTVHVRKNVEGTLKDIYEGTDKVTVEKLLDQVMEPYIVKSNGSQAQTPNPPGYKPPVQPAKTQGLTLAEMRAQQFATQAE